jgi:hypothetical protein
MSALANKKHTLASAVAQAANFTTTYPSGTVQADLIQSTGGRLVIDGSVYKQGAGGFTLTFGASNITVVNDSGVTWAAGSEVILSFGTSDKAGSFNPGIRNGGIVPLTAATGTASDTIVDVTATPTQTTINNNFKSLSDKMNLLIAELQQAGILNS